MLDRNYLLNRKYVSAGKIALNPDNPRLEKENELLRGSMKTYGLQSPLIIRPREEADTIDEQYQYVVVDGDCRLQTFDPEEQLKVGQHIVVKDLTREEALFATIQANLVRKDFTLREECLIIQKLLEKDPNLSQVKLAEICGRSRTWVRERLFILEQERDIQEEYFSGRRKVRNIRRGGDVSTPDNKNTFGQVSTRGHSPGEEDPFTDTPVSQWDALAESFGQDPPTKEEFPQRQPTAQDLQKQARKQIIRGSISQELDPTKEDRTTQLTKEQFNAYFSEDDLALLESHRYLDGSVIVVFRRYEEKLNLIKWLFEAREVCPLTKWQLEHYTDLSPEEIEKVLQQKEATPAAAPYSNYFYIAFHGPVEVMRVKMAELVPEHEPRIELHREPNHYKVHYSDQKVREKFADWVHAENQRLLDLEKELEQQTKDPQGGEVETEDSLASAADILSSRKYWEEDTLGLIASPSLKNTNFTRVKVPLKKIPNAQTFYEAVGSLADALKEGCVNEELLKSTVRLFNGLLADYRAFVSSRIKELQKFLELKNGSLHWRVRCSECGEIKDLPVDTTKCGNCRRTAEKAATKGGSTK